MYLFVIENDIVKLLEIVPQSMDIFICYREETSLFDSGVHCFTHGGFFDEIGNFEE